ncbi:hypothetical protein Tco_0829457, partial [Tanacetum coccineum]
MNDRAHTKARKQLEYDVLPFLDTAYWSCFLRGLCHLGHLTVAADYFFNNDLEYLKSSDPDRTFTMSITNTKAARYEIEGIEDMVPTLWSPTKVRSQLNKFSKYNVYSTKKILGVKSVSANKLHGYGYLEEIVVKRADHQFYNNDIVDFIVALRMFIRSLVINKSIEDSHLGVESYQKKLNITPPQQTFPEIEFKELYTPSHKPPGVIYKDLTKQKRVMRADEQYKFLNRMLKKVWDELHHRILDFSLEYNKEMPRRKWMAIDRKRSALTLELIDKQMRERRIIRNFERLAGARELEMDYKLMMQHQSDTKVLTTTMEILPKPTSNKLYGRVFQTLCKQGDWFSFAKRCAHSLAWIDDNRSCIKHWKSGFFLIDRRAIPDSMDWRHPSVAIDDPQPAAGSFNMAGVRYLSAHIIKLREIPDRVLVLSGLSRIWKSRVCDPVLRGADGNGM